MIIDRQKLLSLIQKLKTEGKRIIFTNGCFDILHSGHAYYLKKTKELGDILIIGINSDESVKKIKQQNRPINKLLDRMIVLNSIKYVDYVVPFNEETPENLIKIIKPDVLTKGGDWNKKDVVGSDFVKSYGGRTVIIPYIKGKSTTNTIKKIRDLFS
ncbi:MAG: D-glycero-beta-D-manno-heptose 1-phosphate adenylyltransferase [Deltaproteobacteria bacterium]|nr:D-glycero-beta-D-manno-heptose 1-phosphate adenylyltransferase [Deltaproteobacteria bacterium]